MHKAGLAVIGKGAYYLFQALPLAQWKASPEDLRVISSLLKMAPVCISHIRFY